MQIRHARPSRLLGPLAITALLFAGTNAWASNPAFQSYFFDVCQSATGTLAARCSETIDSEGNVSTDSESSLNPSQILNANAGALAAARGRSKHAQERADRRDHVLQEVFGIGAASVVAHLRASSENVDRRVDLDPERGYRKEGRSLELGIDYRLSAQTVLGVLASYDSTRLRFDAEAPGNNFTPANNAGRIESDVLGLTAFALFQISDRSYVDAALGYASGENTVTRNSVFQESRREIPQTNVFTRARHDQTQRWLSLNLGYDLLQTEWTVTAFGAVHWTDTRIEGFAETDLANSGLAMHFRSVSDESVIGLIGLNTQRAVGLASGVLLLHARIEYQHQFSDDPTSAAARFVLDAGNNVYQLTGASRDQNYFSASAGFGWVLPGGWMPFLNAEGLFGYSNRDSYRLTAGLRKEL
jgi:uncharacterized protein YhjY with autotransporter beta-barrel domain